jgi:hypothetical protein
LRWAKSKFAQNIAPQQSTQATKGKNPEKCFGLWTNEPPVVTGILPEGRRVNLISVG